MRDLIQNVGIQIIGMIVPIAALSLVFGFFEMFKWWAIGGVLVGVTLILIGSVRRREKHQRGDDGEGSS